MSPRTTVLAVLAAGSLGLAACSSGAAGGTDTTEADSANCPGDVLDVVVSDLEPRGDLVRVRAGDVSADVLPGVVAALDLVPCTPVRFSFDADDAVAYPL